MLAEIIHSQKNRQLWRSRSLWWLAEPPEPDNSFGFSKIAFKIKVLHVFFTWKARTANAATRMMNLVILLDHCLGHGEITIDSVAFLWDTLAFYTLQIADAHCKISKLMFQEEAGANKSSALTLWKIHWLV